MVCRLRAASRGRLVVTILALLLVIVGGSLTSKEVGKAGRSLKLKADELGKAYTRFERGIDLAHS